MITQEEISEVMYDKTLMERLERNMVPQRPAGYGVTAKEYGIIAQVSTNRAMDLLNDLVAAGELKKKYMRSSGHKTYVFYE